MNGRIYTVPLGTPFLKALAEGILNGDLIRDWPLADNPLRLADITILLPTRRAARAAEAAFLEASGVAALIMPTIRPISTADEDQSLISVLTNGVINNADAALESLEIPVEIGPLERITTLMRMIATWHNNRFKIGEAQTQLTMAQAANLAVELCRLMDDVEREGVSLHDISNLVPDMFAGHWQATVDFLKIVTETFPDFLEAADRISPAARTNLVIGNEAQRISSSDDGKPVIVAGVTGSIPATVDLMRAVMGLRNGAVVVPGLDLQLDEESWQSIYPNHPEHPQFGLRKLLEGLNHRRADVITLGTVTASRIADTRARLISEALRPSTTTARWRDYTENADTSAVSNAIKGLNIITAPTAHDEAEAVALILREAIETPGQTAALISPDRILARRVAIRLRSLGIRVDDSAGRPFIKTVPGTFLNLVIDAAASGFAPAPTMALLKHPLCRLGLGAFDMRRRARALEIMAFRRPYLGRGIDGVIAALEVARLPDETGERQHPAARRLWDEDRDAALELAQALRDACAPLTELFRATDRTTFQTFVRAHIAAAEALAALPVNDEDGSTVANPLWTSTSGEAAATLIASMLREDLIDFDVPPAEYRELFLSLVARENVREGPDVHPRVTIWGPLEARLQQPDVVVLGSLNEGKWPEAAEPGAWLNRPMRASLGLPQPEEEVGRAALDFATQLGASQVYLTRAEKVKGVPTVPSRWLMRLEAVLDGMGLRATIHSDQRWTSWARARDLIDASQRITIDAPEPRPAVSLRPRKLSVTAIEEWLRNPYAIFARRILALEPLPPIGTEPDSSLRGALVHSMLSAFAKAHPEKLPDDIYGELHRIGSETLARYTGDARVAAFWLPRLSRFLAWFAETEPERRSAVARTIAETNGSLILDAPAGPFTLTARADRIDVCTDGIVITDYKTGAVPSHAKVRSGQAPQLPLEAAIAANETGFASVSPARTSALRYIRASGGEPPGEETTVDCRGSVEDVTATSLTGLTDLIARFDDEATPYQAVRRPGFKYDYDDYAHLARVAEWSADSDQEDE